jgi:subtilisin family serine protease
VQLPITTTTSSSWQSISIPLDSQFDAGGQVQVRLRLTSDGSGQADGVHMDDIGLVCHGSPSDDDYEFLDGTSMATPMVSGAAALLFAHQPSLSAAGAKAALLDSVDRLPSLSGVTVTGGRLNVYRALVGDFNPAAAGGGGSSGTSASGTGAGTVNARSPNTLFKRKPGKVVRTTKPRAKVVFKFGSSESGSTFRCKLDGAAYKSCAKKLVRHLLPGRHVLKVKAVSPGGAVDPTAAVAKFRVLQV